MKKIISVVGARPNFIKIAPLYREFQKHKDQIQHLICHTGQHFDKKMSDIFFEELKLPAPDFYLGVGGGSHTEQTAKIMLSFEKVVIEENRALSINVKSLFHTHNEYINALLQFGVIGLLVFLNILYQMFRYSDGEKGVMLKLIAISIIFYSLIDVFIIGLGMLLTVVTLTSVSLKDYHVTNSRFESLDIRQVAIYMLIVVSFYMIKLVLP